MSTCLNSLPDCLSHSQLVCLPACVPASLPAWFSCMPPACLPDLPSGKQAWVRLHQGRLEQQVAYFHFFLPLPSHLQSLFSLVRFHNLVSMYSCVTYHFALFSFPLSFSFSQLRAISSCSSHFSSELNIIAVFLLQFSLLVFFPPHQWI